MSQVKDLWELQNLENSLEDLHKEIKTPPLYSQLKRLKTEIESAQGVLRKVMEEKEVLNKKTKSAELDCADIKEKMQPVSEKLYSGEITNPKELDSINHNLEAFQEKLNEVEEKLINLLEQKEELEGSFGNDNQILADKKQNFRDLHVQFQNAQEQKKTEKTQLEAAFKKLSASIDKNSLEKYNKMKANIPNPIAQVVNGMCSGCHMAVNFSVQKELKIPTAMVLCDNCGRLIWQEN